MKLFATLELDSDLLSRMLTINNNKIFEIAKRKH